MRAEKESPLTFQDLRDVYTDPDKFTEIGLFVKRELENGAGTFLLKLPGVKRAVFLVFDACLKEGKIELTGADVVVGNESLQGEGIVALPA